MIVDAVTAATFLNVARRRRERGREAEARERGRVAHDHLAGLLVGTMRARWMLVPPERCVLLADNIATIDTPENAADFVRQFEAQNTGKRLADSDTGAESPRKRLALARAQVGSGNGVFTKLFPLPISSGVVSVADFGDAWDLEASGSTTRCLYIRQCMGDLLNYVNLHQHNKIMLQGPPGIGKTWVGLLMARVCGASIFISFRRGIGTVVVSNSGKWEWYRELSPKLCVHVAAALFRELPDDYVIIDGLDKTLPVVVQNLLVGRRGMLVTSTTHIDIKFPEVFGSFTFVFLPSWTWRDFEDAAADPEFAAATWPCVSQLEPEPPGELDAKPPGEQLRAFMKHKFEICGGSARLMFG
eukprot:TRINITY_DN1762_c0_g1_i13.p1 TRINITY_DN1762_c0_g1~~TRINITY_DN1762_c0_g1_i13.p1  ORF type:complete len:409 (+),score=86.19 TRINITY_DN1762_c0_g1_i13:158-1228(+)